MDLRMKTFGDSTKTPGEHIDDRCYILAQFAESSQLDWARDLRSALGRIGAKFNDATVFAARAHAAFDMDDLSRAASTNELFLSPYRRKLRFEVDKIDRVFDEEHPKSAAMLNKIFGSYDAKSHSTPVTRVSESRSDANDWLQAADFCAGFASELMMNASDNRERELRRHFRRVIFNGATC